METKTISTKLGNIIGIKTDFGAKFLGIRYATSKRFEKPVEIEKYDGDYMALENGPCCYQMRAYLNEEHRFYYKEFRQGLTFKYSEDCHYLNIYWPENANKAKVIIFIHGGSFTGGSIDERQFDGSEYARRGYIFVSMNYRLNIFGCFADKEHSNGNLCLYDQYTAINWVIHNIEAFGGDKDNITLMGQSAGAMSVQTLICSDKLKGKIKHAVMLSGGGIRKLMLPLSKPNYRYWKSLMKISNASSYDEFVSLPDKVIWTIWREKKLIGKGLNTKIVIDGDLVKSKKYNTDVPTLLSVVKKDLMPIILKHMANSFIKKQKRKGIYSSLIHFDHLLPGDDKNSFHSCDLWYALGSLNNSLRPMSDEDYKVSKDFIDTIISFIETK